MAYEPEIADVLETDPAAAAQRQRRERMAPAERAAAPEPFRAYFGTTPPTAVRAIVGRLMVEAVHTAYLLSGNDLGAILVLLEISERSYEHRYPPHTPVSELAARDQRHPPGRQDHEALCACNVLSLSEVDGMPRETVRRKIAKLLDLGWIEQAAEGGYVVTTIGTRIVDYLVQGQLPGLLRVSEQVREFEQHCESARSRAKAEAHHKRATRLRVEEH